LAEAGWGIGLGFGIFFEFVEILFEKNQIFTSWLEVSLMRINW
jgi:hypothetical protein